MAAHLAGTHNPSDWTRATAIEPGNAAYWYQLGLYQEWDFVHGTIGQAIVDFQRGTRLNPRSSLLWTALAGAYEASGQIAQARQAYERARSVYPVSAEVAWQFGSFLLRRGETQQAAQQVRRALQDKPALATSAVSQFSKAGVGLDEIFAEVLPARRQDYLAAFNYFVSQQDNDAALASWEKLAGLGTGTPLDDSLNFIGSLIGLHRYADAERVWRQALTSAGMDGQAQPGGSLIFNGGFERSLVNGGFGWRWLPTDGAVLDLVGDVTHGGSQSARVIFDGTANVDFGSLRQYAAVEPGVRYRFSAYMRTDGITSDSGPQFAVWSCTDPSQPLAATPPMTGTHPWTEVQTSFIAGAGIQCADIWLRRARSQMFDDKIGGTVWVDDVRLYPASAAVDAPR